MKFSLGQPSIVASLVLLPILAGSQVTNDGSLSLIRNDGLEGWAVEHNSPQNAYVSGGVLTAAEGAGWLRIERIVKNFNLHVEGRLLSGGHALFVVGGHGTTREPVGYVLPFLSGADTTVPPQMTVLAFNQSGIERARRDPNGWQVYDIRCDGAHLTVMLNGALVIAESIERNCEGWIGLRVEGGSLELRNAVVRAADPEKQEEWARTSLYLPGTSVTIPRLRRDVKPHYTADAMRARVAGVVLLECVVGTDGRVSDVRIARSLDPVFGLDQEAMKAAKRWQFDPAKRFGEPVPVVITIEMTFTLGK